MPSSHTFLFADLAGFTALTEAHGDEGAADAAEAFFACVRALLPDHSAHEVKTIGDAVMARAEEASAGVALGLAIVEAVKSEPPLPSVRVGMDTGECVQRAGDWFGSAVNTAARLAAAAGGWQVLLTEGTHRAAGAVEGVDFQRQGELQLKNLPTRTLVYRAVRAGAGGEGLPVDPVCRMTIAENASVGRLTHDGVGYEFCSLACAAAFARHPDRYVGAP